MNVLLPVHVAACGFAMVLGFTALFAKKGGIIHRRSGFLFVYPVVRALPIVLLFGAMFYWLWRVRSRRALPARVA